jgi:hypothetical protein
MNASSHGGRDLVSYPMSSRWVGWYARADGLDDGQMDWMGGRFCGDKERLVPSLSSFIIQPWFSSNYDF